MNNVFEGVPVDGIIKPGEIYIFADYEEIDYLCLAVGAMYTITRKEELLAALEMDFCLVLSDNYEVRKFLGVFKRSEDCHEFKVLLYAKDEEAETEMSVYLHRVLKFEEKLGLNKRRFIEE